MSDGFVSATEFTKRIGWTNPATVYRKLQRSRVKDTKGEKLTRNDMPLPDDDTPGAPRWRRSTLNQYARTYVHRGETAPREAPRDDNEESRGGVE